MDNLRDIVHGRRPVAREGSVYLYHNLGKGRFEEVAAKHDDGEKTILLRQDTRYVSEGHLVEAAELSPETRVFVRAGKNSNGQIEAYQVVWGEILEPR